jgi:hypothetical protein
MNNKIIIPKTDYSRSIVRMGTIFVNLNDTLTHEEQIKNISEYIFSNIYNMCLDIICIQGISDTKMAKKLVKYINLKSKDVPFDIVPHFDTKQSQKYDSVFEMTWKVSSSHSGDYDNLTKELILSRYPIIKSNIYNLYENTETKIIDINKIIVANININGYIINIFNISLFGDTMSGISGYKFRKQEILKIKQIINKNNKDIDAFIKDNNLNFINKNITFISGLFNIPEIKNDKINNELIEIHKELNSVDIFRLLSSKNSENYSGINNTLNTRDCYICLNLHSHNDEEYEPNEIIKKIYNDYGLTFINSYVLKNFKIIDYYPIEVIFILDRKEKSK